MVRLERYYECDGGGLQPFLCFHRWKETSATITDTPVSILDKERSRNSKGSTNEDDEKLFMPVFILLSPLSSGRTQNARVEVNEYAF